MAVIHKDLAAAECHEDKHIISAPTTDAGKVVTPHPTVAGTGILRNLIEPEIITERHTVTGLSTQTINAETVKKPIISVGVNANETVTVLLGAPNTAVLRRVTVIKSDNTNGEIRVQSGSGNINGYPYVWLKRQYESVTLLTDGTNWVVVGSSIDSSGYQFVRDSQYTSGSPLAVAAGVRTKITINNLGAGQENYKDSRYDLWDQANSRMLFTRPGDVMSIRLAIRATMASANGYFDLETSFPAPATGTNVTTESMAKGSGIETRFIRQYDFYVDEFSISQGYMEIWVTPSVNMNFYGASLLLSVSSASSYGGNE